MRLFTYGFTSSVLAGCATLLIIGLAFPQTSGAAVYKWKDDNGKLHFTDQASKIPLKYRKKHNKPIYKALPPRSQSPGTSRNSKTKTVSTEPAKPIKFSVVNSYGQRTVITVRGNTVLFAMATWCPYSKKFVRFLNDPSVSSKMQNLNLIFVFKDEWPHIKKQLDKSVGENGVTQKQVDAQLERYKEQAKGKVIYNPAFTRDLPGMHFFATPAATKLGQIFPNTIPTVYSPSQKNFDQSIMKWLWVQFKGEKTKRDFLRAEYKKYNKGEK